MTTTETELLFVSAPGPGSPFGEVVASEGDLDEINTFKFSTKYFDEETDQGDWGLRIYEPQLGRWLGKDRVLSAE